ncbi:type VI secretion system accessory protein TagJ [Thaumasiovibrio sp. DFM-14]|uniref:type VI secretion system accessory protein TagJ n=1 Tax=Thaumasiovibrio sp. DFM-14 TaxID=3384792 RepID=UPI0039A1E844
MSEWKTQIQAADLAGAIKSLMTHLQSRATDIEARSQLVELLCIDGQFERAEQQLLLILKQDPDCLPGGTELRHLIHAAQARADFMGGAATAKFLGNVNEQTQAALMRITLGLAQGAEDLDTFNQQYEQERTRPNVLLDDKEHDDLRDLDDQLSQYLECFGTNGEYYLVPMSAIASLSITPPANLIETVWRKVELEIIDGPSGELHMPITYYHSATDAQKLGKATDWLSSPAHDLVIGAGHKMLLAGEDAVVLGQIEGWSVVDTAVV